ncbi:MAG: ATP-binding cassette domain-containing protein [Bdellovibrionota bacterium]
MTAAAPLEIENLSFAYRNKRLFRDVSLTVKSGEFVTIMGENGAGKTTLIDLLVGHLSPSKGKIAFWGEKNSGAARDRIQQKVGWVFAHKEDHAPWLKLDDIASAISPLYPNWNDDLFRRLSADFKLDLKARISHLSSGEASKFRLLKAVSFEPELLVLDELTANLSPGSKDAITSLLLDRFSTGAMSVLYVCHSTDEALRLSDRVLTLSKDGLKEGVAK